MKSSIQRPIQTVSRKVCLTLALWSAAFTLVGQASAADPGKIVVQVDKPGAAIPPTFYGLMTEEINYSYDGGLYGELIRNRMFKDAGRAPRFTETNTVPAIPHWSLITSEGAQGDISLDNSDPVNTVALTTSLKLTISAVPAKGRVAVVNDGYWGIPVHPKTTYQASFYAKGSDGFTGPLTVAIESNDGKTTAASATVKQITDKWQKYTVTLSTGRGAESSTSNHFVISAKSQGTVNFNFVSLFPPTFKNRPNGDRVDLSQLLDDMSPRFLRFPGGNYVEGNNYSNRFDWKATIGPIDQRPGHMSPWGYRSTDGMGLLEFLGWCEDLKMEPVLAVFAAYTLNGQSYPDEYARFAQEALEEIEYVTGDVNTKWGARRAQDGHPAPFKLTYVEIGNEDPGGRPGGQGGGRAGTYPERFTIFYDAIKAKYPNLKIISTRSSGYGDRVPDVVDEHFYMNFNSALNNAHMYDNRSRTATNGSPAPRIFVGEWATRDNLPTPSFHCALTDAAFLTGLERNADIVVMSCYAPLFVNLNPGGQQWATDLIGYNAIKSFGSPSYYVQKMFYNNKGDVVLPITVTPQIAPIPNPPPSTNDVARGRRGGGGPAPQTLFASSSRDEKTGDVILKVVNAVEMPQQVEINLEGIAKVGRKATIESLTGDLKEVNSLKEPMKIAPKKSTISASTKFVQEFPGNTVTVIRFTTK